MDARKPRFLLSEEKKEKISEDEIRKCCGFERVNGSPYDLRIYLNTVSPESTFYKLGLFFQQNPLIYSLEIYGKLDSPYYGLYVLPVLTYHPGLRVLKFYIFENSMYAAANLFHYNTNLTTIEIKNLATPSESNKHLSEFVLLSLLSVPSRNLCKLTLPAHSPANQSKIFEQMHVVSALQELNCFLVKMDYQSHFLHNLNLCKFEKLIFSAHKLTDADTDVLSLNLANHRTLKDLKLSNVGFVDPCFMPFVTALRENTLQLQSLQLHGCEIPITLLFYVLEGNYTLTTLGIVDSKLNLADLDNNIAQLLASNKTLKRLTLLNVKFFYFATRLNFFNQFLDGVSQIQSLEDIEITFCKVSDLQLARFASKLEQNTNLKSVLFSEPKIGDLTYSSVFKHLTQISTLEIGFSELDISFETATLISKSLASNHPMKSLTFESVNFSRSTIEEICNGMAQNTTMKYFRLGSSQCSCHALINLLSSNLTHLYFNSHCPEDWTPFLPTIIQLLTYHPSLKTVIAYVTYTLGETESYFVKRLCEMLKTNRKLIEFHLFTFDLPYSPDYDFSATIRDYNYSLTYFISPCPLFNVEEFLERNRLIRQSRKFHKGVTLFELLLPFLRIE